MVKFTMSLVCCICRCVQLWAELFGGYLAVMLWVSADLSFD